MPYLERAPTVRRVRMTKTVPKYHEAGDVWVETYPESGVFCPEAREVWTNGVVLGEFENDCETLDPIPFRKVAWFKEFQESALEEIAELRERLDYLTWMLKDTVQKESD